MIIRIFFYSSLAIVFRMIGSASATTEWFGDLRAHLNPSKHTAFYDLTYDDSDCSAGVQSNVIPEFVYFGEMVAAKAMSAYTECLHLCLITAKCQAVNFFESLNSHEKGFCELLAEGQHDNPRLMRPFRKASYYDQIRCKTTATGDDFPTPGVSDFEDLLPANVKGGRGADGRTESAAAERTATATDSELSLTTNTAKSIGTTTMTPKKTTETTSIEAVSKNVLRRISQKPNRLAGSDEKINNPAQNTFSSGSDSEKDAFLMGFTGAMINNNNNNNKAPTNRNELDNNRQISTVAPSQRLSRREQLQKLAEKIREFNRKFAVH